MGATYAKRGQASTSSGGLLLAAISLLAAILVIAGLIYATGIGARRKVLLAAGDCAPVPSLVATGLDCITEQQLAEQYTRIMYPVIQQLNADVAAYSANEGHDLAAAKSAVMAQVTLAKALDKSLARFPFPAAAAPRAKALMQAINASVKLTAEQARSSSLAQLRSFNGRTHADGAAIRTEMKLVRKALFARPTANQEP